MLIRVRNSEFSTQLTWSIGLTIKKPHAYRTIGEASKSVGVPAHVLRFWETKFSQIRPMKKGGGRRYFRPGDIELLSGIRVFLYEKDFTIKELQAYLRKQGLAKVIAAGPSIVNTPVKIPVKNPVKQPPAKPATARNPATKTNPPAEPEALSKNDSLRHALSRLTNAREILSTTLKNR